MARMFFESNIQALVQSLRESLTDFGFDRPATGAAPTVGDAVREIFSEAIHDRSTGGVSPEGGNWDANSDEPPGQGYASRKRKETGQARPNVYGGQMLSEESIHGELRNGHHETDYVYGIGIRTVKPNGDAGPSDREKAQWAHEPNRFTGVTRPFFGITEEDADRAANEVADALIAELAARFR
jgi:hypothetical protein